MEATRLALALLVGFLVLGMCMSKPAQTKRRLHRRHETRQYSSNCTGGDYECGSGECIPPHWECDGWDDCQDAEDEFDCDCTGTDYTCFSGDCIPSYWECDGWDDCPGGEDEFACGFGTDSYYDNYFSSDYFGGSDYCDFQCNSGDCIFSSWVCDGITDCFDGEDEAGCDYYSEMDYMHFCLLSDVVVPTWMACDRIMDCPFGDDEWLGCFGIHDGLGFGKKSESAKELPSALRSVAKKHMKTQKSLTNDQKEILDIINNKQSELKKSRLAAKKALAL